MIHQQTQGKLYLTGAFLLAGTSVVTGYLLSATLSSFTITAAGMGIVLCGLLPFYVLIIISSATPKGKKGEKDSGT